MIDHLIRTDVQPLDKRAEVGEVYGYLTGEGRGVPVILDKGRVFGVLNERGLVKSHLSRHEKLDRRYVTGTRLLRPRDRVAEALDVLAESKLRFVPVVDGDRLVGVVDAVDLLGEVEADLTASDACVEVPILKEDNTVGQALHWFHEVHAAHLPMVNENGRLVGVIHRASLVRMEMDQRPDGREPATGETVSRLDVRLTGLAEHDVPRLPPDAPFGVMLDRLKSFGYALAVDVDERPLGVVTPEEVAYRVSRRGRGRRR